MLVVSVAASVWAFAGLSGFVYLAFLLIAVLPGLPLGFALFGRRHFAGWLAGGLLGYATTTLTWWAVIVLNQASTVAFTVAWIGGLAGAFGIASLLKGSAVQLPPWSPKETGALVLLLFIVPVLVTPAFAKLGSIDGQGNHLYRAYFIADFVWHRALAAELAKNEPRPRNPFLADEPVHYYWTYFRVPATIAAQTGVGIEEALKVNAFATAFALIASIYLAAWVALPSWPLVTALAVALTTLCASAEGMAAIADVVRRGLPLSTLRDLNIDAIAAWAFKGLRIDNLPRTMWYTPQHGMSCALGLAAVPVAIVAGINASVAAILLAGSALAASVAFNPLIGAVFCAVYGLTVTIEMVKRRVALVALFRQALAMIPVGLALVWCTWNEVGEGAGAALHVGFWGLARNATAITFLLQFGPIMIPLVIGLWLVLARSKDRALQGPALQRVLTPSEDSALQSAAPIVLGPSILGVILAIIVMHFLALTVDPAWVGFRGGNIFFVLAPALVAAGFVRLLARGRRQLAIAIGALVIAAGLPTTIIDAYNTQDVTNFHPWRDAERVRGANVPFDPSAEYRWTMAISRGKWEALTWIRTSTPPHAVVQAEPVIRGRDTWSLIPTFAERRMATGIPIPLLARSIYAERNDRVKELYRSVDPRFAWQEAKALGIDYLYVDETERRAYPAVDKFDANPDVFAPVFRNAEAAVYALRP